MRIFILGGCNDQKEGTLTHGWGEVTRETGNPQHPYEITFLRGGRRLRRKPHVKYIFKTEKD